MDIELEGDTITVTAEVAQQIGEGGSHRLPEAHRWPHTWHGRSQHRSRHPDARRRRHPRSRLERDRRAARHRREEVTGIEDHWDIHRTRRPSTSLSQGADVRDGHQGHRSARALRAGRQDRPLRRCGRRQDDADPGDDPPGREQHGGVSVFAGVGERTREGTDLWIEMQESGVIEKAALVYGQMDEPPGVRLRVALSALTIAEYFRDVKNQDVMLFVDNIFRYVQAGSEVSTLLGRMPSAVGYQPTLADEIGELQERITSTKGRSITSLQAVYVPADDYTTPRRSRRSRTSTRPPCSSRISRPRHLPGRRPARVDVQHPGARDRRARTTGRPADPGNPPALQGAPGHHRHPRARRALGRGPA